MMAESWCRNEPGEESGGLSGEQRDPLIALGITYWLVATSLGQRVQAHRPPRPAARTTCSSS